MNLEDLVGVHLLDGVDYGTEQIKHSHRDELEDADYMRFRLDGVTYLAIGNPQDGYRSCMGEFTVDDRPPAYTFPPALVEAKLVSTPREADDRYYGDSHYILEIYDVLTGELALAVGTQNTDDYYPSFISRWCPQALAINKYKAPNDQET